MNLKQVLESALTAAIGGALTGATAAVALPAFSWNAVAKSAAAGAIVALAALWRCPPSKGTDAK